MEEDQMLVTLNEMIWFCGQIDTVNNQLADVIEKFNVLKDNVDSYTLYYGAAAETLKEYFAGMTGHLSMLTYYLSLGNVFMSNTLTSAYELDEEMQKAMDTLYAKFNAGK